MSTTIDDSYIPDIDYGDFDEGGGGHRVIFIVALAVVLLAVAAVAYWLLVVHKSGKQTLAAVEKTTDTWSMPQQTMNLSDGSLVQVTVVLHLTTVADKGEIGKHSTELTNAEIYAFGSANSSSLLTTSGKNALGQNLVTSFNSILGPVDKLPQIQGVYFTQFVIPSPNTAAGTVGSSGAVPSAGLPVGGATTP